MRRGFGYTRAGTRTDAPLCRDVRNIRLQLRSRKQGRAHSRSCHINVHHCSHLTLIQQQWPVCNMLSMSRYVVTLWYIITTKSSPSATVLTVTVYKALCVSRTFWMERTKHCFAKGYVKDGSTDTVLECMFFISTLWALPWNLSTALVAFKSRTTWDEISSPATWNQFI